MRLLLLIAVIALGTDALFYNGHYTQAAYREASAVVNSLTNRVRDGETSRPVERREERREAPESPGGERGGSL